MDQATLDKIKLVKNTIFGEEKFNVCANNTQISGWVIKKPQFEETPNGGQHANWLLFQLGGEKGYSTIVCSTYSENIIKKLKLMKGVYACVLLGRFVITKSKHLLFVAYDAQTPYELKQIELEPPYERPQSNYIGYEK